MIIVEKPSKFLMFVNKSDDKPIELRQGEEIRFKTDDGEEHQCVVVKLGSKEMIVNEDEPFDRIYGYEQLLEVEIL